MLWTIAPESCLLYSNYAPHVSQYSPQIQHLLSFIQLKLQKFMSIIYHSLCLFIFQCCAISAFWLVPLQSNAHLAVHIYIYIYIYIYVLTLWIPFRCICNFCLTKLLATTDSLKSYNAVQSMCFTYYYAHNYAGIIGSSLSSGLICCHPQCILYIYITLLYVSVTV